MDAGSVPVDETALTEELMEEAPLFRVRTVRGGVGPLRRRIAAFAPALIEVPGHVVVAGRVGGRFGAPGMRLIRSPARMR